MSKKFTVQTVDGKDEWIIATEYDIYFNGRDSAFLEVYGDDDFEDGEITLRVYNLDYVVDYGWEGVHE